MTDQKRKKEISPLDLTGDLAKKWVEFLKDYKKIEKEQNIRALPEDEKIQFLLKKIGKDSCTIFYSLSQHQQRNYDLILSAYENHCRPKGSVMTQRAKFYKRKQQKKELFDEFYYDLQGMALTCDFGCDEEKMMRDQIVRGIHDRILKKRVNEYKYMNLWGVVEFCREWEFTELQMKANSSGCCCLWTICCKLKLLFIFLFNISYY